MARAMGEDADFEDDQFENMTTDEIIRASCDLDDEIRSLKKNLKKMNLNLQSYEESIKANREKIKRSKELPYLIANIVE
ncbi:26S protease regulatory subunit 6A-like protein, partial [Trifolium medium]|nr:26S protease regulatory subunit 6A-like protein [Trifolium medium]